MLLTVRLCSGIKQLHSQKGGLQHSNSAPLCVCMCMCRKSEGPSELIGSKGDKGGTSKEKPWWDVRTKKERGGGEARGSLGGGESKFRTSFQILKIYPRMLPSWAVMTMVVLISGATTAVLVNHLDEKIGLNVFGAAVEENAYWEWVEWKWRRASCHTCPRVRLIPAPKTVSN